MYKCMDAADPSPLDGVSSEGENQQQRREMRGVNVHLEDNKEVKAWVDTLASS